jgi:putative MATE family efflux protein
MSELEHKGVEVIRGDPKVAIRKQSLPLILTFVLMMGFSVADSIWVSGLGTSQLAALGFISPLFFIITGLGNGLGAGVSSSIARFIGAEDKRSADNAAMHGILLGFVVSLILTILLLVFIKPIILFIGAGSVYQYAFDYAVIVFSASFTFILSFIGVGVLRGEGDVNRASLAMISVFILNMVIDPIFIYTFKLGIGGAAIATVLSTFLGFLIVYYWLIIKKDTYLSISFHNFVFDWSILKDILNVSLPACSEEFIMQGVGIILNYMLIIVSGAFAVAVFTAGWRLISFAIIPALGIASAALTVGGVAFGERDIGKLSTVYSYSLKLTVGATLIIMVLTYVFAPQISSLFAYSSSSLSIQEPLTHFLRACILYFVIPIGIVASFMFQAVGKGYISLLITLIRECVLVIIVAYVCSILLGWGEVGVWYGMIYGCIFGSLIAYGAFKYYLKRIGKDFSGHV